MYVILWYNNWLVCKATPEVSRVIPSALFAPLLTSQTSCLCQRALSLFPVFPFTWTDSWLLFHLFDAVQWIDTKTIVTDQMFRARWSKAFGTTHVFVANVMHKGRTCIDVRRIPIARIAKLLVDFITSIPVDFCWRGSKEHHTPQQQQTKNIHGVSTFHTIIHHHPKIPHSVSLTLWVLQLGWRLRHPLLLPPQNPLLFPHVWRSSYVCTRRILLCRSQWRI